MEYVAVIALVAVIVFQQFALFRCQRNAEHAMTSLLERIHTSPRIEVVPLEVQVTPQVPAPQRLYISDEPYDDKHWNDTVAPDTPEDDA